MKNKKRIKVLEKTVAGLLKIVAPDSITLTDRTDPLAAIVISYKEGTYAVDRVTTTETTKSSDNIIHN
jgi:hypothetical protein